MDQKTLFKKVQPRLVDYSRTNDLLAMREFIGVVLPTIEGWASGRHPAKGENLLRLWHFLAAAGFKSPELRALEPYPLYVSELFAYSIISIEEARQLLGIRNNQSAYKQMRGELRPAAPSLKFEELSELYDSQLQEAKMKLKQQLVVANDSQEPSTMARGPSSTTPSAEHHGSENLFPGSSLQFGSSKDSGIITLATMLSSAMPLARYLNSDSCTPEHRSRFRDLMGDGNVFEISNILNSLCSERARTDMKGR